MSDDTGRTDRARAVADIRAVYDTYQASGRSGRWTGREPGSRIAIRERDAWVQAAIGPVDGRHILDLGCGDGHLARDLADDGHRPGDYLGLDIIDDRLAEARIGAPEWARFESASADHIPAVDGWADVVVAMTLLSSITEEVFRHAIAAEIRRVLRPGGRLVVYDIRYPSPSNRHVAPLTSDTYRRLFPGWSIEATALTVLPPLTRRWIAGGERRYRLLNAVPAMRSHLGVVLTPP